MSSNDYYMKLMSPLTLREWYDVEQRVKDNGSLEGTFVPFINNNVHLVVGVFFQNEQDSILFSLLMY